MERLGLRYPIFQSPMAGVSTAKLAAAVIRQGGLGSLPLAGFDLRNGTGKLTEHLKSFADLLPEELRRNVNLNFFCHDRSIQATVPTQVETSNWKKLFSKGFGDNTKVDLNNIEFPISNVSFQEIEQNHPKEYAQVLDLLSEFQPKVVSFHFGLPSKNTVTHLQGAGTQVLVSVTSVEEALAAVELGVFGVVCQGYEAGGHRGNFLVSQELFDEKLSTYLLTKLVLESVPSGTFVVAAGGIMSGKDINTYLDLGVDGVQLGTAFLDTKESLSNGFFSTQIESGTPLPTIMTSLVSGKSARCLRTPFIEKIMNSYNGSDELPAYGYSYSAYKSALKDANDSSFAFYLAGQGYPFLKGNGLDTETVFRELVQEMEESKSM
ncbi:putative nitronate monooxygenase [[Candida] anglica]|uniref:Nitronate monooxygenase n=1 Tax=[Candida] anglica TaxID=148631 RepID=A0ABP0EDS8_9ASCO